MIKLNIKNESESKVEKEFKGVLSLKKCNDGSIALTMLDEKDPREFLSWLLLTIRSDGSFYRCENLPDDIGLQVDDDGRIIESEE